VRACVRACVRAFVRAWARGCVRARVRARARMRACVRAFVCVWLCVVFMYASGSGALTSVHYPQIWPDRRLFSIHTAISSLLRNLRGVGSTAYSMHPPYANKRALIAGGFFASR
jgi:hypothetical protein